MRYNEIINVKNDYQAVFNMTNEKKNYWKNFVTNISFEKNLSEILNNFENPIENDKKSIWIEGTYGTGKSHSSSVIKHIFSDNTEEIDDFTKSIIDINLRTRIRKFRENNRIFPVVLKGICNIETPLDMIAQIQSAVKKTLNDNNYFPSIKTEFELTRDVLSKPEFSQLLTKLKNDVFNNVGYNEEKILKELENENTDVLNKTLVFLKENNITLNNNETNDIEKWLSEVANFLRTKNIATDLVIFWDEFTPLLTLTEKRSILNVTQNIAELSQSSHVYLFIITHVNFDAFKNDTALKGEHNLVKDRFIVQRYEAQYDTIYQILYSSLDRLQSDIIENLIDKRVSQNLEIMDCIEEIAKNSPHKDEIISKLKNLYPLHPYTSFTTTFLARNFGSSQRSIFDFLNDDNNGFKKFLNNNIEDHKFITLDYIWDFFLDKLTQNPEVSDIVNCYKNNYLLVESKNPEFLRVFKGILLLNSLQSSINIQTDTKDEQFLISPYSKNIILAFSQEIEYTTINSCLKFLDDQNIITKTPDEKYEIALNNIQKEILDKHIKLTKNEYNTIESFTRNPFQADFGRLKSKIEDDTNLRRHLFVTLLSSANSENEIVNNLLSIYNNDRENKIILGLFINSNVQDNDFKEKNLNEINKLCETIIQNKDIKDKPIVLTFSKGVPLTQKIYDGVIKSLALDRAYKENGLDEQALQKRKDAQKWISDFFDKVSNDQECAIYYSTSTNSCPFSKIAYWISSRLIPVIFSKGLDSLNIPSTPWKSSKSPSEKTIEKILSDNTNKLQSNLQGLLKDTSNSIIFSQEYKLTNIKAVSPLVTLINEISQRFEKLKTESSIDLVNEFSFVFKPPYGYGLNEVSSAAIAIAFRPYINQLFDAVNGESIDSLGMKARLIKFIKCCLLDKNEDIRVRFSTKTQQELLASLCSIFCLPNTPKDGLNQIKWAIRDKVSKEYEAPIWVLQFIPKEQEKLGIVFDTLFEISNKKIEQISEENVKKLLDYIKDNETDLINSLNSLKEENLIIKFIEYYAKKNNYEIDANECFEYLKEKMPGNSSSSSIEYYFWEKNYTQDYIKQYATEKANPLPKPEPIPAPAGSDNSEEPSDSKKYEEKIVLVTDKLNKYSLNNDDLKNIILQILKNHPENSNEILTLLEKYGNN